MLLPIDSHILVKSLILLIGLSACQSILPPRIGTIGTSSTDSGNLVSIHAAQHSVAHDTAISLKGKVGKRVPVLDGTVYELYDQSDRIWVLTKQPLPEADKDVVIQGTVRYQSIPVNGKEQGSNYIEQRDP
jgi:hypothetical protein